ncbi:thioredoxin domain-containing protein [Rhodopirellula sp. JC740]|uniref:Thioredoxin domain-containing protein n=1 Tax=Rhodopirellula halodulae TaxID=2894198 RepID=A0ABS8NMX2_9BACT|nr:vitamin K epoxide reductase family protein [Rhodopirellula sp. JC740]MCC9644905.1 thioredoxin domain-containing protein [Rhodopirellula sp. JC740]
MATADYHSSASHALPNLQNTAANWRGSRSTGVNWRSIRWNVKWLMIACSVVALASSSYLAWSSFTSSPVAGCSGGELFDCGHVLHSRWSKVASIPVSVPAILTHVAMISLLLLRPTSATWKKVRWGAIGVVALTAGGAALWFLGLQVFALGHLCPYCMVAHFAGLILAGAFLYARPLQTPSLRWLGAISAAGLFTMIGLQLAAETPETFEVIEYTESSEVFAAPGAAPAESDAGDDAGTNELFAPPSSVSSLNEQREPEKLVSDVIATVSNFDAGAFAMAMVNPATLLSAEVTAETSAEAEPKTAQILGGVRLSTKDWPLIGNPEADMVFVEMFDYTCPHCQRTHAALEAAREHFGDRLAVMAFPVPLDGQCNPAIKSTGAMHREACDLAKLAVAVWMVDREKFGEFHAYLFESKPNHSQALSQASKLVDEAKLKSTLAGKTPSEYIAKHIQLYQRAGSGTIPKLLFPKTTTVGAVESSQSMIRLIEQNLGG